MATTLKNQEHFDAAIPFNWAALSNQAVSGEVNTAAQGLVAQLESTIARLGVGSNDVVDIQLIGHSRGADVVTQAAAMLASTSVKLTGGNLKLTLLDPHPSENTSVPYYSFDNGPVGYLSLYTYLPFQTKTADPPIVIPSDVTGTEVFYQRALAQNAASVDPQEPFFNAWGVTPISGAPAGGITYYNLTTLAPSHSDTYVYYQNKIVPTLGKAAAYPVHASAAPGVPTNGGASFTTLTAGRNYEQALFVKLHVKAAVATTMLTEIGALDVDIVSGQYGQARSELATVTSYVMAESGSGMPAATANELLALFQRAHALLYP